VLSAGANAFGKGAQTVPLQIRKNLYCINKILKLFRPCMRKSEPSIPATENAQSAWQWSHWGETGHGGVCASFLLIADI
jgi:hypothetical protein